MAQTLEEVRDDLYKLFNKAVTAGSSTYNHEVAQQGQFAAAKLADSLVRVEAHLEEKEARKSGVRLPGK